MSAVTGSEIDDIPTDTTTEFGGEYGEYGEEGQIEEEELIILDSSDFISGPFLSEGCTVPENILEFDFSYGYDCKRYFNLVAPDENTLVFASGNLIHFLDVTTKELKFRRSYLGGGIGHITVNPHIDYPHLTIAENGDNPPIIIYEWPSMDIVGILKDGAAKRYAHINYSPDGELLVSQSYAPDFLITVWQWKKWRRSPIILRTKSHVHEVYRVKFSPYVPGQITSGGAGHIKFWKMAQTFTGLKLQGELGRFGKTEISDIVGIYPMPDEKVISGSEWGNLLIWEAGLIKIEVLRTLRRNCHGAPVMQLEYHRPKGEIWSVSQDGWLRAWEYRIIDEADPPDDDRVVQMVPSYERENPNVQFMSVCKKKLHDPEDTFYYAQDGNGGLWLVDLILRTDYEPSVRLKDCHAGAVVDMAACPWGPHIVSLGEDGRLIVYNYLSRELLYIHQFPAKGRTLLWLPLIVEPSGVYLIMGFDDGVVRVCVISLKSETNISVTTVQSTKPHNKPLTALTMNPPGSLIVTGGEDKTIFVYELKKQSVFGVFLQPIGFIPIETIVTCFVWHPTIETVLLMGCIHGDILEVDLPTEPVLYTKISYLLHTIKPNKQRFTTCKSQIRRDLHIQEIETCKAQKIARKRQEIEKIKADGLEIDEEAYLVDSESEEVLEPLHIPEIPNKIWFMMFTPEDTIWLSMGGYDAGYIYEYQMDQKEPEPLKATIIEDGDDIEMHGYIYSPDEKYLITSMDNGAIRVNQINPDNFRDLSDYWLLSMHDNFNGQVTRLCFSYNNKYMFSCGKDGNVFSYKFNSEDLVTTTTEPELVEVPFILPVDFDENYESLSLEETMIKAEKDKQMRLANEHKKRLRQRLAELTAKLSSLLERNCDMPKSQRYTLRQFIIDDRIMKALDDTLEAKVALERRKLAYDVEKSTLGLKKMKKHFTDCLDMYPIEVKAINTHFTVKTLPQRALGENFFETFDLVEEKIRLVRMQGRPPKRMEVCADIKPEMKKMQQELEPFLVGLSPSTISFKLGIQLTRLLSKYRIRREKREKRQEQWNELYSRKPVEGVNHPDDVKSLDNAKVSIGDFKLKSDPNYKVPPDLRESTVSKYQQLLLTRLESFKATVHHFNQRVYKLRDKKVSMIKALEMIKRKLDFIHSELPDDRIKEPPPVPEITAEDYPEKEMIVKLNIEPTFKLAKKKKKEKEDDHDLCEGFDQEKEALGIANLPNIPGSTREIIEATKKQLREPFDAFKKRPSVKEEMNSPYEMELKARRLINKMFEQDMLIAKMNTLIANYDKLIKEAHDERFKLRLQCTFMDLHLLVLNQELIIVKDFEVVENDLRQNALDKLNEMLDMRDAMRRIELNIEARFHQIELCNDRIKHIQQAFLVAAKDNKFWDFLRRIFKKKYRPPKVVGADESESSSFSSESSTESEDEAASLDSRDIGPIRLDESICPKGCDKELYDYTFSLRSQRHELEKQIKDELKSIDNMKKELEQSGKKMRIYDQASKKSQEELEEFQRLKQQKLNEIICPVVLKLDKLQHLSPGGYSAAKITDTLVFEAKNLSALYSRVGELQMETIQERARHRMNVDCRHMERKIASLHKEIAEAMKLKFGRKVNIDDLEEAILKRMVLELRLAMLNIGAQYEKDLGTLREKYGQKQIELKNMIRENTARLELLAVLNREKADLARILVDQTQKKQKVDKRDDSYFLKDIDKLMAVVKSQQEQIQILKSEIKVLSTKSLPLQTVPFEEPERLPQPEKHEEAIIRDFGSLDELYIAPDLKQEEELQLKLTPYMDTAEQEVTEDDIISCTKELIEEIVLHITSKEDLPVQETIAHILAEAIDQIPSKYLMAVDSQEYISELIKEAIKDEFDIDEEIIIESVASLTRKSVEDIKDLLYGILNKICEK